MGGWISFFLNRERLLIRDGAPSPVWRKPGAITTMQMVSHGRCGAALCAIGATILMKDTEMARPTGVEPVASRLEVSCSIQLSYGRACLCWPVADSGIFVKAPPS